MPQVERLSPFLHLHLLLLLEPALQWVAWLCPGSSQSPVYSRANKPLEPFQVKVGQAVSGLEEKCIKRKAPSVMSGWNVLNVQRTMENSIESYFFNYDNHSLEIWIARPIFKSFPDIYHKYSSVDALLDSLVWSYPLFMSEFVMI